jgi:hypothetical protein
MPERYDARFYPHGSKHVHYTADTKFKIGDDSTVTSLCGKTYTRWLWAEHIDKPLCPACAKKDAALTQDQINAVTWALDGQTHDHAQDGLARLARAFNFRIERFVWCNSCTGYRPAGHQHS